MKPKKILVVDDEPSITSLLKLNLEKTGAYTVRVENEGAQALPAARQFKPDLVLLDVMMPDLDGGDAAAQIRADPLLRDVPIVFLTAAVKKEELKGPENASKSRRTPVARSLSPPRGEGEGEGCPPHAHARSARVLPPAATEIHRRGEASVAPVARPAFQRLQVPPPIPVRQLLP